jgi:hypothetical protein
LGHLLRRESEIAVVSCTKPLRSTETCPHQTIARVTKHLQEEVASFVSTDPAKTRGKIIWVPTQLLL